MNYFSQSIRNLSNNVRTLIGFSLSELKRHVLFAGVMVLSSIQILQLWHTYNYNNDDFNPRFGFCNSETSDLSFATQEDIFVFDFQMCFWRHFFKLRSYIFPHRRNHCKFQKVLQLS